MKSYQPPQTSLEAYRSLKAADISRTKQRIISALQSINEGTMEDIAEKMGVNRDIVWKRLSELERDQKIYRPGTKKTLKSGKKGFTWKLIAPVVNISQKLVQPSLF